MIKEIHMKGCATYDMTGASLVDCKKVNFIYGANGSGKSTISNFLADQMSIKYAHSSIVWSSSDTTEINVYNREFRELNIQKSDIEGVFTIGKATIEDIKELDSLKAELSLRKSELAKSKDTLDKQEDKKNLRIDQFRKDAWESIYKPYAEEFGEAFDGYKKSKDKFCQEVIRRFSTLSTQVPSLSVLKERAATLYSSKPELCELFDFDILKEEKIINEIEKMPLWNMAIVGNDSIPIAKLIKQLEHSDWVRAGQKYVSNTSICPFCQKETIDEEFKNQLEQFFAGEYEKNVQKITELYDKYLMASGYIMEEVKKLILCASSIAVGKVDKDVLETKKSLLESQIASNITAMQSKIKEPSVKVYFVEINGTIKEIQVLISDANQKINQHNNLVNNIKTEKINLANDIWKYCLYEHKALIEGYFKDVENLEKAINGISKSCTLLQDKVRDLEKDVVEKGKNITSVQPTVDEMNRLLKSYGFTNFLIAPSKDKKNCYQIQRQDGTLVSNTLSEGEETFISFLYFMQLTKGSTEANKVSAKKIIVLDDPICSLDSTILYVVSSMVKQLSEDIRAGKGDVEQLFILTHNVFFHKEASFINGRTQELKDVNYWIIRKEAEVSKINSYGMENPISTSYALLWRELREDKGTSIITLQNIMRRIIENYFGMLGGKKEDYIKEKFETLEEQTICESLFYWINDGSHSIPDDLYINSYTDATERYKDVFYRIFKATGHEAHYNMMMGIDV